MKALIPFAASVAFAAAACSTPPGEDLEPGDSGCPILSSEGWRAYVNAMPGPERPRLVVTGRVTVPTGGWSLSLAQGPTREIDPPVQEVILHARPPEGPASQALVTEDVTGTFPALPRYGGVVVRCEGEVIARIDRVDTAH